MTKSRLYKSLITWKKSDEYIGLYRMLLRLGFTMLGIVTTCVVVGFVVGMIFGLTNIGAAIGAVLGIVVSILFSLKEINSYIDKKNI